MSKTCPHCGQPMPEQAGHAERRDWVLTLRYMLRGNSPVFGGLLKRLGLWGALEADSTLRKLHNEGLIETKGVEGFIVTDKGRYAAQQAEVTP